MKRLLTLFMSLLLFASMTPSVAVWGTQSSSPKVIFDMDLTGSTADNISITDKSGAGEVSEIKYHDPEKVPEFAKDGDIAYLSFGVLSEGAISSESLGRGVKVVMKKRDWMNKTGLTFEMWARRDAGTADVSLYDRPMGFGVSSKAYANANGVFDVKMVKNQAWVGRDSSNDKADWRNLTYEPKMFSDTAWAHFVITREWTPTVDSAPFGAGTWVSNIYRNGKLIDTITTSRNLRNDYTSDTLALMNSISIGNSTTENKPFLGDISEFRMYDGTLDAEGAGKAFSDTRGKYMDVTDISSHTLDGIGRDTTDFSITFSGDVDIKSLSAESGVYIKDGNDNVISAEYKSYNAETKTAVYSLVDYPRYGTAYSLCIPGIKDMTGFGLKRSSVNFTTAARTDISVAVPAFTDSSNAPVTSIDGQSNIKVKTLVKDLSGQGTKATLAVLVMDSSGRVVKMYSSAATEILADGTETPIEVTLPKEELAAGYTAKACIWKWSETKGAILFDLPVGLQ